jgi:alpha-tubulin suppressor-like RCC1 family protein
MTIGLNSLSDAVNVKISGGLTSLQQLQLASVVRDFELGATKCVANCAALPAASDNKGRWIFLLDICSYRWSDGTSWSSDFTSAPQRIAYAFGENTAAGKIGDGTITNRASPVSVVGVQYWTQVSAGGDHSIGVDSSGAAWGWGCSNPHGSVGDGATVDRLIPRRVVGNFTDWCQVSAGSCHNVGVRKNGTAWAWGQNTSGRLGDNTTTDRSSPILVIGGFTDWCQVSAGHSHSLGFRTNGTAWGWGTNSSAELGDGTTVGKSSPVSVVGGFTDWCGVSAGRNHSLAVRQNGTAWAWGGNTCGVLGDNTTTNRSSPVSVVGGFTDWCQVSAGRCHSLGVRCNGTAWAWGHGATGRLGDNTVTDKSSPVSVVGGFTDWCQVSASQQCYSLAVRQNGTAWGWGHNNYGQLGDGTTVSKSSPVSVVGGFTDWSCVSTGRNHALAIRTTNVKGF